MLLTGLMIGFAATNLVAQERPGPRLFDETAVVTLKGTVEEVLGLATRLQLRLKTPEATVEVQVGPQAYLKEHKFEVAKGDVVEVTGWRRKVRERELVIAREIVKGETRLQLRSETGAPLWPREQRPRPPRPPEPPPL